MKKILLLLLLPGLVSAQNRQIVEVSSNEDVSTKVPNQLKYVFPEFTAGNVYFLDRSRTGGILNYNKLAGEMQFVDENARIWALNVEDVSVVVIDSRKFYPYRKKQFTEELYSTGSCFLRVKYETSVKSQGKKGAYGMSSSTTAIATYSPPDARRYDISAKGNVIVFDRFIYYLVGANGKHRYIKNLYSFTGQFPEYKSQIIEFAVEHKIQFSDRDDLIKLLKYCGELSN